MNTIASHEHAIGLDGQILWNLFSTKSAQDKV